jgi:AbrB family looped-hinge helix DNA binding protein
VPKEVRNKLGLKRGDIVEFVIIDDNCIIKKKSSFNIDKWIGFLEKGNTDEFIKEIRGEELDNCC